MGTTATGWAFYPTTVTKAHYFEGGRSLCGRYGNLGVPAEAHEPDNGPSQDDCTGCRRKLDNRKQTNDQPTD